MEKLQLIDDGTVAKYSQTIQVKYTVAMEKFQLNDDGTVAKYSQQFKSNQVAMAKFQLNDDGTLV